MKKFRSFSWQQLKLQTLENKANRTFLCATTPLQLLLSPDGNFLKTSKHNAFCRTRRHPELRWCCHQLVTFGSLSVVSEKRQRHLCTRTSFTGTLPGQRQELPPEGWPVVWERERRRRHERTRICKHGHRSV